MKFPRNPAQQPPTDLSIFHQTSITSFSMQPTWGTEGVPISWVSLEVFLYWYSTPRHFQAQYSFIFCLLLLFFLSFFLSFFNPWLFQCWISGKCVWCRTFFILRPEPEIHLVESESNHRGKLTPGKTSQDPHPQPRTHILKVGEKQKKNIVGAQRAPKTYFWG